MSPETQLQSAIMSALESLGFWVIRTGRHKYRPGVAAPNFGDDGFPDVMVMVRGIGATFLEVKCPGKSPDPDQVAWHIKADLHSVRVATITSVADAVRTVRHWQKEGQANMRRRAG